MPPVFGYELATSASDSAPHIARMPPTTQTASIAPGPGKRFAMPAGERKIPDPIVIPMTMVTALQRPRRLGSASTGALEADMRLWYSRIGRGASRARSRNVRDFFRAHDRSAQCFLAVESSASGVHLSACFPRSFPTPVASAADQSIGPPSDHPIRVVLDRGRLLCGRRARDSAIAVVR